MPLEPDLKIVVLADMLEEVGEEVVGFVEAELVDPLGEAGEEERERRDDKSG